MMEKHTGGKRKKGGGESILSFVPRAMACHHICIKPVSSSGPTCWLSERLLRERKESDSEKETENRRRGKQEGRDPEVVRRRGRGEQRAGEVDDAANCRQLSSDCRLKCFLLVIFHWGGCTPNFNWVLTYFLSTTRVGNFWMEGGQTGAQIQRRGTNLGNE